MCYQDKIKFVKCGFGWSKMAAGAFHREANLSELWIRFDVFSVGSGSNSSPFCCCYYLSVCMYSCVLFSFLFFHSFLDSLHRFVKRRGREEREKKGKNVSECRDGLNHVFSNTSTFFRQRISHGCHGNFERSRLSWQPKPPGNHGHPVLLQSHFHRLTYWNVNEATESNQGWKTLPNLAEIGADVAASFWSIRGAVLMKSVNVKHELCWRNVGLYFGIH